MKRLLLAAAAAGSLLLSAATASASTPGGIITTIVGGPGGPDPAADVSLAPCGVTSSAGQLYTAAGDVLDRVNSAGGRLTPAAGTGSAAGSTASGAPASGAALTNACGATVDRSGNVLFADGSSVAVLAGRRQDSGNLPSPEDG